MRYENPTIHNGFVISADARELPEGCWQGQLVLSKAGHDDVCETNLEHCETRHEAEQSALAMGWQLANHVIAVRTSGHK